MKRLSLSRIFVVLISIVVVAWPPGAATADEPPNIVFILSDDLSWGDIGPYGQQKIKTPNIDRLASEGMVFTQAYSGSSSCAPARSSLMEGLHQGHARVRGNSFRGYRASLQEGDFTVAMLLQQAGYATGMFGKWGLGLHDQPGIPSKMGFDEFYGYLNQQHAHRYYPAFLYDNEERVYFPENGEHHKDENFRRASPYGNDGRAEPNGIEDPSEATYSFDIIADKSLEFVRANKDRPFFLYLPYTIPHGPLMVPELGIYNEMDWAIQHKEWAAMITRMDTEIGRLLDLLKELGLDENTLIFFASDNGDSAGYEERYLEREPGAERIMDFFYSHSPTRGRKTESYNGSFHVPAIARWPGKIGANLTSAHVWAFWDIMPTVAEIIGVDPPANTDGISILPTLLGKGEQQKHEYLYWEVKQDQAVRSGRWFAHRESGGDVELYDIYADPQQAHDLSSRFPDIAARIEGYMREAHTPSDVWPSPGETEAEFQNRLAKNRIPERPTNVANY